MQTNNKLDMISCSHQSYSSRLWCRVPGSFYAHESHGPESGLLRKVFNKLSQSRSVVELTQIHSVSHSLTIGHYAHLKKTHTHIILHSIYLSFPQSMFVFFGSPSQAVCWGCGWAWWGWCDTMFYIEKAEDFCSHGRCDWEPQQQDFPVFPSGKLYQPPARSM